MSKPAYERVQEFIKSMETGKGAAILLRTSVILGFGAVAMFFNFSRSQNFSDPEAMESAHLARQLAEGKGYTTESIRPFCLHLLQQGDPARAQQVLQQAVPDLSNPPAYPFLLAGLMKILPFHFKANAKQRWSYQPELWIRAANELLFFVAVLILFRVARRLFDPAVAWLSAVIFAGTELFWQFSASGLSTIWLVLVFLALVWCLVVLEERERQPAPPGLAGSLGLAATAGALAGLGGLSRYSFAWMIFPVLIFLRLCFSRARGKLVFCAAVAFLAVMGPWIARNLVLSQTCFGTAGYALVENTPRLPDDILERSFHPAAALSHVTPREVLDKFFLNARQILKDDLPRLGGNWASAFFLCGLLLPFRNPALRRFRRFLLWSLAVMAVAQAACQTHLSADSPEINSENLLVVLAPLVLIFGVGVFFTLLDHMIPAEEPRSRRAVAGLFVVVLCAPLLLTLLGPADLPAITPYAPWHIQQVSAMMQPDELMMSDIPWAVAWYGDRPCAWLTLGVGGVPEGATNVDVAETYAEMAKLKPVRAVFLTQRTSDRRFLSQMIANEQDRRGDWSYFYLNSLPTDVFRLATNLFTTVPVWVRADVPTGFPLKKAILDYPPDQTFISDRNRWQPTIRPSGKE
ncbi:MAG TPA: glycosyltransferase family 39 protein [Candidatus Acidoferrum sp.]|nr:glycosyltransferase family 39 protein [Candidatus Acidoferrum sp.]